MTAYTFAVSGAAIRKAGVNANSTIVLSGAALDQFFDEAENDLNTITRYDWISNYSGLGTNFKKMLGDVVTDMVAMRIIAYDMSGYSRLLEAQTMLDVLNDRINKNLEVLKQETKNKTQQGI